VRGGHELSGVQADHLGTGLNGRIDQGIEQPRPDAQRSGLGDDIHALDLGGAVGKEAKRPDTDGTTSRVREQETAARRLVGLEARTNFGCIRGSLGDAVLLS
jgi:hypothetical protein